MWQIDTLPLQDARLITLPAFYDERGSFIKTFNDSVLQQAGIVFELKESYFSFSNKDVVRGMHFQLPPHQHAKIVFCPQGAILDVIVDLRKESSSYGKCHGQVLSASNHQAYYIPEGFAHGFKALTDNALTYYLVSSEYSREHDTGILWDSFGFNWEVATPVISQRDLSFCALRDFASPF